MTVTSRPTARRPETYPLVTRDETALILRAPLFLRVLAAVSMVVLAMRIELPQGVEVGFLVSLALLPLWFGAVRRFRFSRSIIVTGIAAILAGLWLESADVVHATNATLKNGQVVLVVGFLLSIGLVLWARTVLPTPWVALWYGLGLLLSINTNSALYASNPWKFGFFLPVAVILLSLAWMLRRWWIELVIILALTGISAVSDARSAFGLLILAAVLVIAQLPILRAGHKGSSLLVFLGFAVLSIVVAVLGQAAILGGYLGAETQARSVAQIEASGNLLLGGRPELAATTALMEHSPWGFGFGTIPSDVDVSVAKTGMDAIGYDPENNYVNGYMFGGQIELHSVVGDLWAEAGIIGLVLVAGIVFALLWGLSRRIADGTASGLVLYLVASATWQVFFGPWHSAEYIIVIALALVAVPATRRVRSPWRPRFDQDLVVSEEVAVGRMRESN